MDAVTFFEQLAMNTHYSEAANNLINKQADEIKMAFLENNAGILKSRFSNAGYLADGTGVVEV